ncbi:hypothetical protein ACFY4K_33985 [Streptomyces leeuwenhoekii]|uniref:hypothetical protein n=1 Tax=Streptomyces leeuwenhoekii TaxID=1437453 RepID=UPI0036AD43A8
MVRSRLDQPAQAEAASHRALSALPASFRRNRAMTIVDLAIAQLHQGDAEHACATSEEAFALMSGSPLPGRLRVLLGDFYRDLFTLAPSTAVAREWADRYRSEEPRVTTAPVIDLRRYGHTDLPGIRQTLLDVHADAYYERRHEEFVQRFPWFVDHWGGREGFACVVAYADGEPIGFT